jgi:nitroreductase
MDFGDLLKNRRSIREYPDQVPSLEIIREIIDDTCLAPTARNGQPCRFVIVREREFIKRLSDESKGNLLKDLARTPGSFLKDYESMLRDESFNVFYNAPCVIYFTGPKSVSSLDLDIALTVSYFMFSAASRGLGTCWIGLGSNIRSREILGLMGIPEDFRIVAPVILGFPISIPAVSERHAPEILRVV